jgi:hypothetical protein
MHIATAQFASFPAYKERASSGIDLAGVNITSIEFNRRDTANAVNRGRSRLTRVRPRPHCAPSPTSRPELVPTYPTRIVAVSPSEIVAVSRRISVCSCWGALVMRFASMAIFWYVRLTLLACVVGVLVGIIRVLVTLLH